MDNTIFNDALPTPARKIYELLRSNLEAQGAPFKVFYYGDPVLIPESLMPCIVVDTMTTISEFGPTQFDDLTNDVMVKVIFNKKTDFNAGSEDFLTKQKVEYFMEGRDKTTGLYLPNTVQGVLRKNITVEDNASQLTNKINYDVIVRPEDTITQEAHLTLTISSIIEVPNRS